MYEKNVAQVLLTRFDISDRRRYLNARNTLEALLAQGVIPVINENDTVATEEIRVGDNDNLSALVCNLIEADLLMMLTNQEGMFTANPDRHEHAKLIPEITDPNIPDELWQAAGKAGNHGGTGGMYTKLQAADLARRSGSKVVIAHGALPDVVSRVVSGETIGTRFSPLVSNMESRKRFILAGPKPAGELVIDAGATNALVKGKNSLLPVGVMDITGNFERGETVRVKDGDDREVAVGLANYSSESMRKLCGKQSVEIENILGYSYGKELIHRDNMILL